MYLLSSCLASRDFLLNSSAIVTESLLPTALGTWHSWHTRDMSVTECLTWPQRGRRIYPWRVGRWRGLDDSPGSLGPRVLCSLRGLSLVFECSTRLESFLNIPIKPMIYCTFTFNDFPNPSIKLFLAFSWFWWKTIEYQVISPEGRCKNWLKLKTYNHCRCAC